MYVDNPGICNSMPLHFTHVCIFCSYLPLQLSLSASISSLLPRIFTSDPTNHSIWRASPATSGQIASSRFSPVCPTHKNLSLMYQTTALNIGRRNFSSSISSNCSKCPTHFLEVIAHNIFNEYISIYYIIHCSYVQFKFVFPNLVPTSGSKYNMRKSGLGIGRLEGSVCQHDITCHLNSLNTISSFHRILLYSCISPPTQ